MVGHDAKARADGQVLGLESVACGGLDDAVFLIGARHADVAAAKRPAVNVADEAVAEVAVLAGGAAVAGHGHPARVDDHLALFGLVADDGTEHRACNAVHRHDAEIHHEEVAERIDARADFGHARLILGMGHGGRRADRDDAHFKARLPQAVRGRHDPVAFIGSGPADDGEVFDVVACARMRENARELGAVREGARDLDEEFAFGPDARAVAVAVDLNEDGDRDAALGTEGANGLRGRDVVEDDLQIAPSFADGGDVGELLRGDAHGVDQVLHAVFGEVAGLGERGDGGGAFGRKHLAASDLDRLVGLEMRAQGHAETGGLLFCAVKVHLQLRVVDDEGGGSDFGVGKQTADGVGGTETVGHGLTLLKAVGCVLRRWSACAGILQM